MPFKIPLHKLLSLVFCCFIVWTFIIVSCTDDKKPKIWKDEHGVLIVDNFYENPDKVRQWALNKLKKTHVLHEPSGSMETCQKYGGDETILKIRKYSGLWDNIMIHEDSGFIRVTKKSDKQFSFIHVDPTAYNCVIFLNPSGYDSTSGTTFWKHINDKKDFKPDDSDVYESKDPKYWKKLYHVPIKYNRMILFPGNIWHSGGDFDAKSKLGDTLESGRMVQTFFLKFDGIS